MSKNIIIQEGGIAKQLTVDKLKTNLVSSGTCMWVPEDEVQLTTKTITDSGTYKASDDGYYGYSQVFVNVSGAGTATGIDGDGDEAVAYTDPETGKLVEEKVPSSIEVITPPTNPYGIYQDGQTITTDGMVVKAYLETGGEYGTVPNGEITLNPTTAVYDASTDHADMYDYGDIHAVHVTSGSTPTRPGGTWYKCTGINAEVAAPNMSFFLTEYNNIIYAASLDSITHLSISFLDDGILTSFSSRGTGKFQSAMDGTSINSVPLSTADPSNTYISDMEPERAGSHQQITVSWPRPLDGKVLETAFEILVAPGYTPGGGE